MPFVSLASFPNSRIKPRAATQFSLINQISVPANEPTEVRPELIERTVLTIYNQSQTTTLRYLRGDPTDIETKGFVLGPDRAIDLEGPESLWIWAPAPVDISYDDGQG